MNSENLSLATGPGLPYPGGRVAPQAETWKGCHPRDPRWPADPATGHARPPAPDVSQGSAGSGAFVPHQASQRVPTEVWAAHSALGLTLALQARASEERSGRGRQGSLLMGSGHPLWLCPSTPSPTCPVLLGRERAGQRAEKSVRF